jgi:PAS domain S-box-containing protein
LEHSAFNLGVSQANAGVVTPFTIETLKAALIGEEQAQGEPHQNILPAQKGLFTLRRDALRLRRERDDLKSELGTVFQEIETADANFARLEQARSSALSQQVEQNLSANWGRLLILGGGCSTLFLWLSWLITCGVNVQVQALERARAEAESGRQTMQKLMVEQQMAAQKLAAAHKELQASAELYRQIADKARTLSQAIEQSPVSVVITDLAGNITYVNPKFTEATGYSSQEVTGQNARILKSGNTSAGEYERMWKIIAAGREWRGIFHNRKKNGELYWESASIAPVFNEAHKITHFLAVKEDITARKQAEEELKLKNAILSTQQEVSLDGILVVDDNAKIVSYNQRFVEMWGVPPKLIEGKVDQPILEFVANEAADALSFLQRVQYLYEHRQEISREEIMLKDGRVFDRYSAPMIGLDGRYYGRVWFFRDTTERKLAEEELRSQEERTRLMIDHAFDVVVTADSDFRVIGWNRQAEKTLGWTRADILGCDLLDTIIPPSRREARRADLERFQATGEWPDLNRLIQSSAMHRGGREVPVELTITPIHVGQEYIFTLFLRDITERLQAEATLAFERQLLQSVLESSTDCVYFKDQQSRFIRCSKSMIERFGGGAMEIIGKTDFDLFTEEHARPAFEDEQEIMRSRVPLIDRIEKEVAKDGRESWALTSKMPLCNQAGEIIGTFGISKDITSLKRTETQLAYERDLLTTLLDSTPDPIYFKDLQSRFVRVSRSKVERSLAVARANYRLASEDNGAGSLPSYLAGPTEFAQYLAGKTDFDFFTEERARCAFEDEQEIIRTGATMAGKLERFDSPGTKTFWCVTTKAPWRAQDGTIIGTVGVSKDVTFIKEAEEAVRRTEELYRRAIRSENAVPYSYNYLTKSYQFIDEGIEQLIGYSPQEMTPAIWTQIVQESVMSGETAGLDKKEAVRRVLKGEVRSWLCDMRVLTRHGVSRWISDASVHSYDESGHFIGSIGILHDITERKQAEISAVAFSKLGQELFSATTLEAGARIIAKVADELFGYDAFGLYLYLAETDKTQTLLECDTINGQRVTVAPRDWEQPSNSIRRVLENGPELILKDGKDSNSVPFGDTKRPSACIIRVPLRVKARSMGVVAMHSYTPGAYSAKELNILQTLADYCSGAFERIWAEESFHTLQKQLVETSRQAGMAEVATSVLHNVGNVLNSINVGATILEERTRKSRVFDLHRLVKLFDEHAEDPAAFLTLDPKGRKVPAFVSQLAQTLGSEQSAAIEELTSLRANVEHVKEIIAMQQSYARVSGAFENIEVNELLEDTLRMIEGSLARHSVKVVRDFGPLPPICTDKHKVLQILINLVRNAEYACDELGRNDKQVILRATNGGGHVTIAVIDNGIGIPQENLTRIFNHGFTTRKDGHGFGLHSGALAARELGGSLTVRSEGRGQGAVFTLELPYLRPADNHTVIPQNRRRDMLVSS